MARTASVTARPVRPKPSIRRDSPRGSVPSTMPTRWYKFATRVSSDICIQGEPCKRAELVRHVRAVAKLAGGIRVLRAKED